MLTRRQFLGKSLQGSSLIALGATVPGFLARTAPAAAAERNNDTVASGLPSVGSFMTMMT